MRTATKIGIVLVILGYAATSIGMLEYAALDPAKTALAYLGASLILVGGNMAPSVVGMMTRNKTPTPPDGTLFPK